MKTLILMLLFSINCYALQTPDEALAECGFNSYEEYDDFDGICSNISDFDRCQNGISILTTYKEIICSDYSIDKFLSTHEEM